ncbi:MAG: NAD-dependent epimerase/dehydratase family protein [Acidobacteriota bacterium]
MKKILVTGAYGFVGSNLSDYLKNRSEYILSALDVAEGKRGSYGEYYSWKSLDSIDWDSIDVIVHLAGKAHDTKNTAQEQEYYDVNEGLTKKIFDAFLNSNARKFIFFSSVKAIADTVKGEYLTEDVEPDPQTPYGKSKLGAEKYIEGKSVPPGKQVYILRPCMIHGPGNKGNLNLLFKIVQKGIPWPLGAFENKRSFTTIDNIIFIIEELIEKNIPSGTYQVSDDEPLSTNELIRLMAESMSKKTSILNIPPVLVRVLTKTGDVFRLPLNSERLKKLTESYLVSNRKIKNVLGISKMPISAAEGMKKTLSSFNK